MLTRKLSLIDIEIDIKGRVCKASDFKVRTLWQIKGVSLPLNHKVSVWPLLKVYCRSGISKITEMFFNFTMNF